VNQLLVNAYMQQATAQTSLDRVHVTRYFQSGSESHAAKTRDADAATMQERDDLVEFTQQVACHLTVSHFLEKLIEWKLGR
jgi:hypothetical protein